MELELYGDSTVGADQGGADWKFEQWQQEAWDVPLASATEVKKSSRLCALM